MESLQTMAAPVVAEFDSMLHEQLLDRSINGHSGGPPRDLIAQCLAHIGGFRGNAERHDA
jgi:hypothetical protein